MVQVAEEMERAQVVQNYLQNNTFNNDTVKISFKWNFSYEFDGSAMFNGPGTCNILHSQDTYISVLNLVTDWELEKKRLALRRRNTSAMDTRAEQMDETYRESLLS